MPAVVMKFGGSSVADAAAIDRVAAIVAAELARQRTPVVVVSALGGATDALLGLTKAAVRNDKGGVDAGLQALAERHFEVRTLDCDHFIIFREAGFVADVVIEKLDDARRSGMTSDGSREPA